MFRLWYVSSIMTHFSVISPNEGTYLREGSDDYNVRLGQVATHFKDLCDFKKLKQPEMAAFSIFVS